MNWTEGNLNRHSRARKGKETLLRQKEHFAKVRAGLLDANVKISPPSVSFLALPARPPSSVRRDALKSTSSRKYQSDDRLMSSRYLSESRPKLPAPIRLPEQETGDEAMRQKRRKLLLKGDWVGTNVQKPIEMEFTKTRGSPSNPWGVKKSRRQASKHKLRQLLGVTDGEGHNRARLSAEDTFTPTSLRRIKVRVGSYERALGDSSNASPRSNGLHIGIPGSRGTVTGTNTIKIESKPASLVPMQAIDHISVDSDNADSTLAQLGVEQPAVSRSQADENDVWRTFVAPPDDNSAWNEIGTSDNLEDAAQRLISPGISQLGASSQLHGAYSVEAAVSPTAREVDDIGEDKAPTAPAGLFAEEAGPDPSHQRSSEPCPDDDQNAPIAGGYSSPRVGSHLSQPSESPGSNDRHDEHAIKEQNMTAGASDEVSLLVVSSSPKLPPFLDVVEEATPFQMNQQEDIAIELDVLSPHAALRQLHGKDLAPGDGAYAAVEKQLPSERTQEDENDMWRSFVFGDSSENLEKALEEARRDTARSLRPSLPSTSTYSYEESQQGFTTSPLGLESIDRRDFAEELCDRTGDVVTTVSASHVATAGASSADLSSETTSGLVETAMRTDQATHGSPSSSSAASNDTSRLLFPSDPMASSTCEADTSTSNFDTKQLEKYGEPDDCFKFARPKLFVGKKIEHVDEQRQIALSAPQIRGKPQTRRRQRRTTDGRANIRKLPNYGGSDPIEEFEGDCRPDRAEKGSMFGPLETEDGF
ncbi:hypothetical protein INS49_012969 [Diaporthe citri]|uniref:uncharacterized protein n=1 Tax=Diaporthe citri TaxID=83186 RepID=UPI001C80BCF3|nr:uncharacterized protein INS49_012969 [Diaporthe citri]KAG6359448.1 hypothetical protein INS49_012969 [Diaporthe citri]